MLLSTVLLVMRPGLSAVAPEWCNANSSMLCQSGLTSAPRRLHAKQTNRPSISDRRIPLPVIARSWLLELAAGNGAGAASAPAPWLGLGILSIVELPYALFAFDRSRSAERGERPPRPEPAARRWSVTCSMATMKIRCASLLLTPFKAGPET